VGEQLRPRDVLARLEVLPALWPTPAVGRRAGRACRIVTEHVRAAEVGLPPLEDRADIAEHDVVVGDHQVGRILPVRLQGVLPRPNDSLVPMPADAEHVRGQIPDLVGQLLLANACADHSAALDLGEQLRPLILGVEEHPDPGTLVRLVHPADATTAMER
jgi:hypothetical protein